MTPGINLDLPTSSKCGPTDMHVYQEKQEHMLEKEHFQQKPQSSMGTKANCKNSVASQQCLIRAKYLQESIGASSRPTHSLMETPSSQRCKNV